MSELTTPAPASSPAQQLSPRAALVHGRRWLRLEPRRRRLRVRDLPPWPRNLTRAVLAITLLAAAGLAAQPLLESGERPFHVQDIGLRPVQVSLIGVILIFAGVAVAFGLAAYAAPARLRRWVAGGVAIGGLILLPLDHVALPFSTWASFAGLSAIVALLSAAILGVPRSRPLLGILAMIPPLAALAVVSIMTTVVQPELADPYQLGRAYLFQALFGIAGVTAFFEALAMWGVIEGTRALGLTAAGVLKLPRRWWMIIPALALLKLVWLVAASRDWLPAFAPMPEHTLGEVLSSESPLTLALAAVFVIVLLLIAARRWLPPDSASVATRAFWLVIAPIIAAFSLPQITLGLVAAVERFGLRLIQPLDPADRASFNEQFNALIARGYTFAGEASDFMLPLTPLIGSLVAIGLAGLLWWRGRRSVAPFFAAYGAWTIIPAASWALYEGFGVPIWDRPPDETGTPALLGNVHPVTIDALITVVVLVLGLAALRGRSPISPPLLLAIGAMSTIVAYHALAVPEAWVLVMFWVGLALPVFIQFGFDSARLNAPGPDRSARVLFAIAAALLALSVTYASLLIGWVIPGEASSAAMVRQMALLPLALVFLLAFAARRHAQAEAPASSA